MNNFLKSLIISCAFLSVTCVASPELQEETSASRGLFQRCADEAWLMAKAFVGDLFAPFTPTGVMEGVVKPNIEAFECLTKAYPMTPSGAFWLCADYPAEILDIVGALVFPPAKGAGRHVRNLRAVYDMINAVPDDTQEWRVVKAATTLFTLTLLAQEFDFPALLPGAEAAELPDPKTVSDARAFLGEGEPCSADLNDDLNCVLDDYTGLRAQDVPPCNPIEWRATTYGLRFNNATGMPESLYGIQVYRQSYVGGNQTVCTQSAFNIFAPVTEVCVTQGHVRVMPQNFTLEYASRYLMPGADLMFVTGQNNAQQCGQIFPTRPAPLSDIGTVCVAAPSALADGWPTEQTLLTCMDTLGHVDVRGLLPEEAAELGIDAQTLMAAGGHKVMHDPHEMMGALNMPTEDYSQEYPAYTAPLKAGASGHGGPSVPPVFALRPDQCPLNGTRPVEPMTSALLSHGAADQTPTQQSVTTPQGTPLQGVDAPLGHSQGFDDLSQGQTQGGSTPAASQDSSPASAAHMIATKSGGNTPSVPSVFALRLDQCPLNGTRPVAPMTPALLSYGAADQTPTQKSVTTPQGSPLQGVDAPLGHSQGFDLLQGQTQGDGTPAASQDGSPASAAHMIASFINGLGDAERSESFLSALEQLKKTIGDSEEYYKVNGEAPGDFVENLKEFVRQIQ